MTEFTDKRGIPLEIGQYIVYGKSSKDYPLNTGTIVDITEQYIEVLGDGNVKTGKLKPGPMELKQSRIIILPDEYLIIDKLTT